MTDRGSLVYIVEEFYAKFLPLRATRSSCRAPKILQVAWQRSLYKAAHCVTLHSILFLCGDQKRNIFLSRKKNRHNLSGFFGQGIGQAYYLAFRQIHKKTGS